MAKRTYDGTLRAEQARLTRERVLEAVIEALAQEEDLSVPALAKSAGVSVATVYRYFPTREALFDAAQEAIGARLDRPPWPREEREVAASAGERMRWFEDNEILIRAILAAPLGRDLLGSVQRERERAIDRSVGHRVAHLDRGRRRALLAIVSSLDDPHTWRQLRDGWGVSAEDAAFASQWAVETLLGALAKVPADEAPEAAGTKRRRRKKR